MSGEGLVVGVHVRDEDGVLQAGELLFLQLGDDDINGLSGDAAGDVGAFGQRGYAVGDVDADEFVNVEGGRVSGRARDEQRPGKKQH